MNDTTLTDFAREFEPAFAPLLHPLRDCAEVLAQTRDHEVERAIVPAVRDVEHHAGVLLEKVREQQTYVLVFGPLKSGKSTLMNAFASTYVSEVTALPAYPCMVFVSHAPTSSFEVTCYDGTTETLRDPGELSSFLEQAHVQLAERLAEAERGGGDFDPARDFPQAVRRIDVKLPAEELNNSRAVLVDTPGLYTRMKFGYDAMTRDFRHAAACAVFVVKTDNLFLEQVFAEFEELLTLFSRIFLVVNVDPNKQDLGPDGELRPSVEARDPQRILDAFRTYSMSAGMREAHEEGRLKLYTVDLLRAARRRLLHEPEESGDPAGITDLNEDLREFLRSSEYLITFRKDSLRQGELLLDRLDQALEHHAIGEIERRLEEDRGLLEDARERQAALERLAAHDWESACDTYDRRVRGSVNEALGREDGRTNRALEQSLDEWFQGEESLSDLLATRWGTGLSGHLVASDREARAAIAAASSAPYAGLDLASEQREDLQRVGLDLDAVDAAPSPAVTAELDAGRMTLHLDEIPIRRTFVDWILLRGKKNLRRKLFGTPDRPTAKIDVATKQKRLGEEGRESLLAELKRATTKLFPQHREAVLDALLGAHRRQLVERVRADLERRRLGFEARVHELEDRVAYGEEVIEPTRSLQAESRRARHALTELTERFFPTPVVEIEPAEPREEEDEVVEVAESAEASPAEAEAAVAPEHAFGADGGDGEPRAS